MREHVTLLRPDARDPCARGMSSGFPADLLAQSAGRLRVVALLFAFVFFMAGIFPALARENAIQGTPAFISPEQVMGTEVDGRADVYATGCVAYWLLTGQFVFTSETPMGMLVQHAQEPPTPPSLRTELPISRALDDLVLSCLAKDPADRLQSARELSLRLGELESASAWTQDRAREWWTIHQVAEA